MANQDMATVDGDNSIIPLKSKSLVLAYIKQRDVTMTTEYDLDIHTQDGVVLG